MAYCRIHNIKHRGTVQNVACAIAKKKKIFNYVEFIAFWREYRIRKGAKKKKGGRRL